MQEKRPAAAAPGAEDPSGAAEHSTTRTAAEGAIDDPPVWRRLALIWERKLCGAEANHERAGSQPKSRYTPWPQLPAELMPRLAGIVQVLAGMQSLSQAAREVGLSRNHFQSLLHRSLLAMIESLTPKQAGRPAKAALQSELQRPVRTARAERPVIGRTLPAATGG